MGMTGRGMGPLPHHAHQLLSENEKEWRLGHSFVHSGMHLFKCAEVHRVGEINTDPGAHRGRDGDTLDELTLRA